MKNAQKPFNSDIGHNAALKGKNKRNEKSLNARSRD
jgi:hypothetical protein